MGAGLSIYMIVISILFFRDLRLKRVLIFNAVFFGCNALPLIHVPIIAVLAIQGVIAVAYLVTAKTV